MRRILISAGLAATAAFFMAASAPGGKTNEAPALTLWSSQWSSIVEQQPGVLNPDRGCMWDVDDFLNYEGFKVDIPAGTEVVTGGCLTADQVAHPLWIDLRANTPDLTVTVAVQPGFVETVAPVKLDHREYRYCARLDTPNYRTFDPLVEQIPGSNGGWGVPSQMRFSIANGTGRTVRDVNVVEQFGLSALESAC